MAKVKIAISEALQAELADMAAPYLGVEECGELAKALAERLREEFPNHAIDVAHIANRPDLFVPLIRMLVIVDGEWDAGMMFTKPPEPAP